MKRTRERERRMTVDYGKKREGKNAWMR